MNRQAITVHQHLPDGSPVNDDAFEVPSTPVDVAKMMIRGLNGAIIDRLKVWNGVKGNAIETMVHGPFAYGVQALTGQPGIKVVPDTDRQGCIVRALQNGAKRADTVAYANDRLVDVYFDKIKMNNIVQNHWNYASDLTHTVSVMTDTHPGINVTLCNATPMVCPYFESGENGRLVRLEQPKGLDDDEVRLLKKIAKALGGSVTVHEIPYTYHPELLSVGSRVEQRQRAIALAQKGESLILHPETLIDPLATMIGGMVERLKAAAAQPSLPFAA